MECESTEGGGWGGVGCGDVVRGGGRGEVEEGGSRFVGGKV